MTHGILPLVFSDVDDVLVDCDKHIRGIHRDVYGHEYAHEERVIYRVSEGFPDKFTLDMEFESVDILYGHAPYWAEPPMPGVVDAIERYRTKFRFGAITSRTSVIEVQTLQWFKDHIPSVFAPVICSSFPEREDYVGTKPEIVKRYGGAALIDDSRHNLEGCHDLGIVGVLVNKPWNTAEPDHLDFERAGDFAEALTIIERRLSSAPV